MAPDRIIKSSTPESLGLSGVFENVLAKQPVHTARTVTIVITTFNHARYLKDAISSAINQVRLADKIIVCARDRSDESRSIRSLSNVELGFRLLANWKESPMQ
jgi:hypothetical protein